MSKSRARGNMGSRTVSEDSLEKIDRSVIEAAFNTVASQFDASFAAPVIARTR